MSSRAIHIIKNAEEEVGAVLSGPTRFHASMMVIASAFAVATGILFGTAVIRRAGGITYHYHYRSLDWFRGSRAKRCARLRTAGVLPLKMPLKYLHM